MSYGRIRYKPLQTALGCYKVNKCFLCLKHSLPNGQDHNVRGADFLRIGSETGCGLR